MKMKLFIFLVLTCSFAANAEYDKSTLFDALVKKYSHLKTISAAFNDETRGLTGRIKATIDNKYNIKAGTRTIVSNGKTVWNYDEAQKKVIINNVDNNNSSLSVDKLFFSFIENYYPSDLKKNEFGYTFELTKKGSADKTNEKLILWVDGKTLDIFRIQIHNGATVNSWGVVDLQLNRKFPKGTFEFKIPQGVEAVDLR